MRKWMQSSFSRLNGEMSKNRFSKAARYSKSGMNYVPKGPSDFDKEVREKVVKLAWDHIAYGSPMVTDILRMNGYLVNHKRIEAIWKEEGLQCPRKKANKKVVRTPWQRDIVAEKTDDVWSYDFVFERTRYGKKMRILVIIDEYSRECIKLHVAEKINSYDVKYVLDELMCERGAPKFIRSDNGSEFIAEHLQDWLGNCGVVPLYIDPGCPWQNGFVESFNGTMRRELLNAETWGSMSELKVVLEWWRHLYNEFRPQRALGKKTPKQFAKAAFASLNRPLGSDDEKDI